MHIKRLGHVGITVPDIDATVDFYERIFGMQVSERMAEAVYLRCNAEHHCLALFPGPERRLHHLGLELAGPDPLDEAAATLRARGVEIAESLPSSPGYGDFLRIRDPEGNAIHLYHGMERKSDRLSPREIRVEKFGHITYLVTDFQRFMDFYLNNLGFRLSDRIGNDVAWIRCDKDHHGVAFLASDMAGVHHYAFELSDWNAMKRFCDNMWHNDHVVSWGLGRHGPGHNLFFYIGDNSGNVVELFAELDQIWDEETYESLDWPGEPRTMCVWGGTPPPAQLARGEP